MIPALMGLPGKLKTVLDRLTSGRAANLDNLDAAISTRAAAATALSNATWSDGLATSLASALKLDRAEILTISGSGTGGTVVTANLTITAVTLGKCFLVPLGSVVVQGHNSYAAGFSLALTSTTNVQLVFKMPNTGSQGFTFTLALVSFQ